jgi:Protein of unknown function (DUF2934)
MFHMAKDKKTPGDSAPRKAAAAKKNPARRAAATKPEKVVAAAAAAAASGAPSRRVQPLEEDLFQEIRRRAYEFYCERGGNHGGHEADWHRAEREVRAKYTSKLSRQGC